MINLWMFGLEYIKYFTIKTTNSFWKDVYQSWSKVYYAKCQTDSDFHCDHILYNTKITVGWRSEFSKSLYNSGILSVNDLIDDKGNVHAFDYEIKAEINVLEYTGLSNAIKQTRPFTKYKIENAFDGIWSYLLRKANKKQPKKTQALILNPNFCEIKSFVSLCVKWPNRPI